MRNPDHKSPRTGSAARIDSRTVGASLGLLLELALLVTGRRGAGAEAAGLDSYDPPYGFAESRRMGEGLRIRVNVAARRLHLVRDGELLRVYPVAVGEPETPTPRGRFRILEKTEDPTWAPRGRKPVPPGPANPLGHRWMRISEDGYGIHATNDPGSIGRARSHGCIRMSRADAEDLFEQVRVGTEVEIVYELTGYDEEGEPEAYRDVYGLGGDESL